MNRRMARTRPIYRVTHCLREGRAVDVPAHEIAATVSAWLAEFDASSPLVDELAQAVRAADWPAVHAIGEYLSVDVIVAA
jgi:hypothetical protein